MQEIDGIEPTLETQPKSQIISNFSKMESNLSLPSINSGEMMAMKRISKRRSIPTSEMVHAAIKSQMQTPYTSVSFKAIKNYIQQNYLANMNNRLVFMKKYIATALEQGKLLRTKGKGVSGSFRLPAKIFKSTADEKKSPKKKAMRKVRVKNMVGKGKIKLN